MLRWLVIKSKAIGAAVYCFRAFMLLSELKLGLDFETYPCLIVFFRVARLSGCSPKACANVIEYLIDMVDSDIPRGDPRSISARTEALLCAVNYRQEIVG